MVCFGMDRRGVVRAVAGVVLAALCTFAARADDEAAYRAKRIRLIQWIQVFTMMTSADTGVDEIDPRVLAAMADVPRHEFVPDELKPHAYQDTALPIGHEQAVSQPSLLAFMTHMARVKDGDVVFETGTDTGYLAAILSKLAARVYSVEYVGPLAAAAAERLKRLDYKNIDVRESDGFFGWPEHGPFDAIIVKEAVQSVPPPLLKQLKPGGRLIVPVGPPGGVQTLMLIERGQDGQIKEKRLIPVRFRPLQGGERI